MDQYRPRLMIFIVFILILSILDAVFTLWLIEKGATELNPVMAYYLEKSPFLFVCVKYLLTSTAVLLVFFHKDDFLFRTKAKVKILLFVFPIPFLLVISWQVGLILGQF